MNKKRTKERTKERTNEKTKKRTNDQTNKQTNERTDEETVGLVDGCMCLFFYKCLFSLKLEMESLFSPATTII